VERHVREHDRLGDDLRVIERELARYAVSAARVKRLMTIPGVEMVVAVGLIAAIGPIDRFADPNKLVAYLGLNPTVHQSGERCPRHGRITKQGRTHARTMLVEAAWQAVRGQDRFEHFFQRPYSAREPHRGRCRRAKARSPDVAPAQQWRRLRLGPAGSPRQKLRDLEPRSGLPTRRGQPRREWVDTREAACHFNIGSIAGRIARN
jgi:transposase